MIFWIALAAFGVSGPSDEEALGLAFEQLQIHLTARLAVARDEAVEVNARMRSRVTCQRSLNSTP